MASEDAPDRANAAVAQEETAVDEKNVAGEAEPKTFLKGKRRSEQEAQGKAGKQKGQLPRKRFFRARAHSNPLSDCQFAVYVLSTLCCNFYQFLNTSTGVINALANWILI